MTAAVTNCAFLGKEEKQKKCGSFTNVGDEKLETIIYKIELYLKLASLKSLFTRPFKTGRHRADSFFQSPQSQWFSTGGFFPIMKLRPKFIPQK